MNSASLVGLDTSVSNCTYTSSVPATTLGLNKLGANTLTLTGTNAYTGPTVLTGGTLKLGAGAVNNGGGAVNMLGGIFDLGGSTNTYGAVTLSGGMITNGTLVGSSFTYAGGTIASNAVLAGSGALTKQRHDDPQQHQFIHGGAVINNGSTLTLDFANKATNLLSSG